jgi:hypothetical protein
MKKKQTTTAATGDALTATLKPAPCADGKPRQKAPVKKGGRSLKRAAVRASKKPAVKAAPRRVSQKTDRDPRLPSVGQTLEREFKGKTIKVKVTADGFEYDGQTFKSISACARHITGYMISGPVFFKLVEPKRAAAKEA